MAYTEQELLDALQRDLARPDQLYMKSYIQRDEVTTDTEKPYSTVISTYLAAHMDSLKKTDDWGTCHMTISAASTHRSRILDALLAQKEFFHAFLLDGAVTLTDEAKKEIGYFDFMTLDKAGKELTLFEMKPAADGEEELARVLRCWQEKELLERKALASALSLSQVPRVRVVTLVTGAANDRYGDAPAAEGLPVKRLSIMLGVPKLYLFRGIHAVPVNAGVAAPGQMMEAELLAQLEKDSTHPETLYRQDYVNRLGVTGDTGRPYCEVIAAWLLAHRDIWMAAPHGFYRLSERIRPELANRDEWVRTIRRQGVLPPFGRVLPEELIFLGARGQQLGRPALLVHAGDGDYSLLRELEPTDASDSLLRAVLRAFQHLVMTDTKRLVKDLRLPETTTLEARIPVERGTPRYDLFLRDLPYVSRLMKAMGVGLMLFENGCEAMN